MLPHLHILILKRQTTRLLQKIIWMLQSHSTSQEVVVSIQGYFVSFVIALTSFVFILISQDRTAIPRSLQKLAKVKFPWNTNENTPAFTGMSFVLFLYVLYLFSNYNFCFWIKFFQVFHHTLLYYQRWNGWKKTFGLWRRHCWHSSRRNWIKDASAEQDFSIWRCGWKK